MYLSTHLKHSLSSHIYSFCQVEVTCLSCPACPLVCPQNSTNIPGAGSNNYSAVFSPWLSIVAQTTANSMGPRMMSRKMGTLQCGTRISNPSNLEAGEVDTSGFQSSTLGTEHRGAGRESVWLLRPPALPF